MTDESNMISVLVVDDDPLLCELSFTALTEQGFHVSTANSMERAIFILQSSIIDVVISDVQMPHGSGIDLLNEINKMRGARPPVFLVSAFSGINAEDARRLGAVDLFEKPIDYDQLGRKIILEFHERESAKKGKVSGSSFRS